MSGRRREPWRPRWSPSPTFLVTLWALVLAVSLALISGCAKASQPTQGERDAYVAGLVSGSFNAYAYDLMRRLHAAGVPAGSLVGVIERGCRRVTVEEVAAFVLEREPLPKSEADVTVQVYQAMDHACASLRETSS